MLPRGVAAALLSLLLVGCSDNRERPCHIAAKSVVAAPESKARGEMERLLAFGRYALPDIEQEFHGASTTGRLRLLEVLRRLRLPETIPFVEVVARWDAEDKVREEAKAVAAEIAQRPRGP